MAHLSDQFGPIPTLEGDIEFRLHRNKTRNYSFLNGQLVGNQKNESSGLSSRRNHFGLYGFAAHPEWSSHAAEKVLKQAEENLKVLSSKSTPHRLNFVRSDAQIQSLGLVKRNPWSEKEIIERLKDLDSQIESLGPLIKSRKLIAREQSFEKEIWTGFGGHCQFDYVRTHIYFVLTADSKNGPVQIMDIFGGRGFLEDIFPSQDEIKTKLKESYQQLGEKVNGVYPKPGKHTVILASKLAGILAHEAIGHTTEADLVRGGSVAGQMLGREVASPLVTLVDFAHSYNGQECPVPVYHDDECVKAEDTVIIEKGVLKTFMNSRETAAIFDQPATGHSRAWDFGDEPLIRMRNTAILPGKDKIEDMIASVDNGYYLIDHSNGQADSTSEFMFGVTLGYEIKNGKLGAALLDTTISGLAFDMLKTVSMVSDELTWVDSGTCGKKQPMYVGMGGPAVKCEITLGGRS